MDRAKVVFSGRAIQRMFQLGIRREDALAVLFGGEAIAEYPDDVPHPSRLLLGSARGRPVHVVVAFESEGARCIVVTVYEPRPGRWVQDFKTRSSG